MPILSLPLSNALRNISYLIYCPETRDCLVVDPLEVDPILEKARANHLKITKIVNTHEHWDHVEGNLALKTKTKAEILAHHEAKALIPGFDKGLQQGDILQVGNTMRLTVLETPGHTQHSICLFDPSHPALFTGDTLFNCGCGNCHHGGDPETMFHTFETKLQPLPNETELYPGHDYLANNLGFVQSIQPDLPAADSLKDKIHPGALYISTLGEDKTVNPFFRCEDQALIEALAKKCELPHNPTRKEVFLALRALRNTW
jgi:hydroxyacylglutathione hydrolase